MFCILVLVYRLIPIVVPVVISQLGPSLPIVARLVVVLALAFCGLLASVLLVWLIQIVYDQGRFYQWRRRLREIDLQQRAQQEPLSNSGQERTTQAPVARRRQSRLQRYH